MKLSKNHLFNEKHFHIKLNNTHTQLCAHTNTPSAINLKACRVTPWSEKGDPDSQKRCQLTLMVAVSVWCSATTEHTVSTELNIDAIPWQRPGGTMPQLFLGLCSHFSLTKKKLLSLVLCSSQQLLGVKRVYSSHPDISQPNLRKCPFGSCHVFCDWQWIKFGGNNCGSCCWPQVALKIVWQAVEYGCFLVHHRVGATSLLSAFLLPSFPWWSICFGDTLG